MTVINTRQGHLNWNAKGRERIAQNVRNLLGTFRYEVAYHRTLGLPGGLLDRAFPQAAAELEVEARQLIARYEPRAVVEGISCRTDKEGNMEIEVTLG